MKPLITVTILETVLALAAIRAQPTAPMIYGAGVRSCGSWLEARKDDDVVWQVYVQWTLGFLSAANVYLENTPQKTDSDAVIAWLDNYCRDNPLSSVRNAMVNLVLELQP